MVMAKFLRPLVCKITTKLRLTSGGKGGLNITNLPVGFARVWKVWDPGLQFAYKPSLNKDWAHVWSKLTILSTLFNTYKPYQVYTYLSNERCFPHILLTFEITGGDNVKF